LSRINLCYTLYPRNIRGVVLVLLQIAAGVVR
jgi:hypothetical protein